jgi:hypothetical protein
LARGQSRFVPESGKYVVLGTVEMEALRKGLASGTPRSPLSLADIAEFKEVMSLRVEGGWERA